MKYFIVIMMCVFASIVSSCQSSGHVAGNENGSQPINEHEGYDMQKAVNRCHRTGGSRVVKIKGELKCF